MLFLRYLKILFLIIITFVGTKCIKCTGLKYYNYKYKKKILSTCSLSTVTENKMFIEVNYEPVERKKNQKKSKIKEYIYFFKYLKLKYNKYISWTWKKINVDKDCSLIFLCKNLRIVLDVIKLKKNM